MPTQLLTVRSALPYAWPDSMPAVDQPLPDLRQLLDPRAEQVDPLAAGDLGVQAEVAGDLADQRSACSGVISPPGTRGTTE